MVFKHLFLITSSFWLSMAIARAADIAIVIDDFGYRPTTENQILKLPKEVTVSVLPNAPHAKKMAEKAHQQGRDILIHLPMAPIKKQSLEKNTLFPSMSQNEIDKIIKAAIDNVPYAIGINNHMGSAMTADFAAMQRVMSVIKASDYFFLDSMTTAKSQGVKAAQNAGIPVLKRAVFLDHELDVQKIRRQMNIAIATARKNGNAIVIGHPNPSTVAVLNEMLYQLPSDVRLVRLSSLLSKSSLTGATIANNHNQQPLAQPIKASELSVTKGNAVTHSVSLSSPSIETKYSETMMPPASKKLLTQFVYTLLPKTIQVMLYTYSFNETRNKKETEQITEGKVL